MKDRKILSRYLMKVHGIPRSFSRSKTFGFYEILYCIVSFMTEIWCFTRISQILSSNQCWAKLLNELRLSQDFVSVSPIQDRVTFLSFGSLKNLAEFIQNLRSMNQIQDFSTFLGLVFSQICLIQFTFKSTKVKKFQPKWEKFLTFMAEIG